jgi:hypothetical protein
VCVFGDTEKKERKKEREKDDEGKKNAIDLLLVKKCRRCLKTL